MLIGLQNFKKFKEFFFLYKNKSESWSWRVATCDDNTFLQIFYHKKCKILYFQENFIRDLGFNPCLHQKLIGVLVWW